jgi:hypothetical protein
MTYKSFNNAEIQAIKEFIESYFLNRVIEYFTFENRRPFAVHFKDNWIIRAMGRFTNPMGSASVGSIDDNNREHSWGV